MGCAPVTHESWSDFHLQVHRLKPGGWSHPGGGYARLTVPLSRAGRVRRRLPGDGGAWLKGVKRQGTVSLMPPRTEGEWEWLDPSHFGLMFLPEALLREALAEAGADPTNLVLRPAYAEPDSIVGPMFHVIQREIGCERRASRLLVSSAALFLARHLLVAYGAGDPHADRHHAPLGNTGLQRVLDAIETNPSYDWSVSEMAREAGLSPFWFAHTFKATVGVSPRHYVQQRRLSRARSMLACQTMPIADVAAACGFESQSWFTTVFRQRFGTTPAAYRMQHC